MWLLLHYVVHPVFLDWAVIGSQQTKRLIKPSLSNITWVRMSWERKAHSHKHSEEREIWHKLKEWCCITKTLNNKQLKNVTDCG